MRRYIETEGAVKASISASRSPLPGEHFRRWLDRQPTAPELVSRQVAADIMGVQSPHVTRYVKQGRMPEPLPVEGSAPVYLREEVEKLGVEIRAEREAREARKEDD